MRKPSTTRSRPNWRPPNSGRGRLFRRFNIEVLATTDTASDPLAQHRALAESGWDGRVVPTFRPDAVVNLLTPGWSGNLAALGQASGSDVTSYAAFIRALEDRRAFFKRMGAAATDHAAETAFTGRLDAAEAEAIFQAALRGLPQPKMPGASPATCSWRWRA